MSTIGSAASTVTILCGSIWIAGAVSLALTTDFNPLHAWCCVQLLHGYQGRLDVSKACKKFGYRDGAFLRGTGRNSVDDWTCKDGQSESDIRLSVACTELYGGSWADYQVPIFNYWDPHSITCLR